MTNIIQPQTEESTFVTLRALHKTYDALKDLEWPCEEMGYNAWDKFSKAMHAAGYCPKTYHDKGIFQKIV